MKVRIVRINHPLRCAGRVCRTGALLLTILFPAFLAANDAPFRAVTDNISYNAGESVRLRVIPAPSIEIARLRFLVSLRYAGEAKPILKQVSLAAGAKSSSGDEYVPIWKVPTSARTGRYEIDLQALDAQSRKAVASVERIASFAVHRKLVRIERVELNRAFYTPGDPIACRAVLRNLSGKPMSGLRVEFSERYWPWIARASGDSKVEPFPIVTSLALKPGTALEVRSDKAAVARQVTEPATQQYAVVVWDSARTTVLDIAFSPIVFIRPPGENAEEPYPLQYVYPKLSAVNTDGYRKLFRPDQISGAIQFNAQQTMYAPGDTVAVKFTVTNNTYSDWNDVAVRASLRALGSAEFGRLTLAEKVNIASRAGPLEHEARFSLPSDGPGAYRVVAEVVNLSGDVLAENELELAANPLPKSILVFCAHEDDEVAHRGIIRAAVENRIPVDVVYFTSGDAGSCDRYYGRSCGAAEALNFGALRMDEARASLGHLGVPRANIHFLGLPDGGSGEVWARAAEGAGPYLSVLLASDHVPFEGVEHPNLPYTRRAVVNAAKTLISRLKPDVIYTGHPDERHVDHRTNNWFVVQAMQELLREAAIKPDVELLVDQTYGSRPQNPAPYRYDKHLLFVTPEVKARAQEAEWFYQSQSGNRALGKLRSLEEIPRQEVHWKILDWKDHAGWNEGN